MIYSVNDPKVEPGRAMTDLTGINGVKLYMHGDLQVDMGFDIACTDEKDIITTIRTTLGPNSLVRGDGWIINSIDIGTEATDPEGNVHKVIITVWRLDAPVGPYYSAGVIVKESDIEGRQFARDKAIERPWRL